MTDIDKWQSAGIRCADCGRFVSGSVLTSKDTIRGHEKCTSGRPWEFRMKSKILNLMTKTPVNYTP